MFQRMAFHAIAVALVAIVGCGRSPATAITQTVEEKVSAPATVKDFPFLEVGKLYTFFEQGNGFTGTVLKDLGNGWVLVESDGSGEQEQHYVNLNVLKTIAVGSVDFNRG